MGYERSDRVKTDARVAFPSDLVALLVAAVVLDALTVIGAGPIRTLAGLPVAFFLPGYALTAALFPRSKEGGGPGTADRIVLAFGMSLAMLPLVVLAIAAAGAGLTLTPVLVGLGVPTVFLTAVAVVRRKLVPREQRYRPRFGATISNSARRLFAPASGIDRAINLLLAISVVLAAASFGVGIAMPNDGESFTDATLLTETDDGELAAGGYPAAMNDTTELTLALENFEGEEASYTAVVELQRASAADGQVDIEERDELDRLTATVAAGQRETIDHEIEPTMTGEDLRVAYYVYRGDVADDPDPDEADRELYFWTDVPGGDAADGGTGAQGAGTTNDETGETSDETAGAADGDASGVGNGNTTGATGENASTTAEALS